MGWSARKGMPRGADWDLTIVHQPIEEMVSEAVRNLVALIIGTPQPASRTILPGRLVVRRSTAYAAG